MHITCRGYAYLNFDKVWFAKSNKIGIVLQVGSVVTFDKCQPVNCSLTLQPTLTLYLTDSTNSINN